MITIAGRTVNVGDMLYHNGYQAWAKATAYDPSGSLEVQFQNAMGNRKVLVTNGGNINGVRQFYWHEPLTLDLPVNDVTKYQGLVDYALENF